MRPLLMLLLAGVCPAFMVPVLSAPAAPHWAFQPPQRPPLPTVKQSAWVRNPIDAFVIARLEQEKVSPSPETDHATLLRRLSFDLRGLPPSPAELAEWLADYRPNAYEALVERLL